MSTISIRTVSQRSRARGGGPGGTVRRFVMIVTLPLLLVGAWFLLSAGSTNYLNPPLATILGTFGATWFGDDIATSRFVTDVLPSVGRIVIGYLIALVIGTALGIVIGLSRTLRAILEPVLEFFRAVPPPVLVPIFMLIMGIGPEMRISVIAIGCLWPILLNTVEGVRAVDPVLRDTADAYRFSARGRLFRLILPSASPQIITGARQALSIGIILMVISEMFAGRDGLGFTIVSFQRSFAIPEMWGGVILLGIIGVVFALIFRLISGVILKWYYGYLQAQRGGA